MIVIEDARGRSLGHVLEDNTGERRYFEKANKNGRAAWRRCYRVTTGDPAQGNYSADVRELTPDEVDD